MPGGSSNLYIMMHIRGHRSDYDNWAYNGCPGWSYDECLSFFQRLENQEDDTNPTGGKGGPLHLSNAGQHDPNPTSRAFLDACAELGFPSTDVGDGWLIFDMPEADVGCHPADPKEGAPSGTHSISFYCDDIAKTVKELQSRGVEFTGPVENHGYGLVTLFKVPGGFAASADAPGCGAGSRHTWLRGCRARAAPWSCRATRR